VIHHLDPQTGQKAVVDQGKTLFQPVTYLRPAKAHLTGQV
jgi:hypothetical protein